MTICKLRGHAQALMVFWLYPRSETARLLALASHEQLAEMKFFTAAQHLRIDAC